MKKLSFYACIIIICLLSINMYAQDTNRISTESTETSRQIEQFATQSRSNAQDMSRDLSTRLSLTPDQQESLNEIFWNYQKDISTSSDPGAFDVASSRANDRIDQILNENQRNNWSSIRDSWWSDMRVRYGNTGTSIDKNLRIENETRQDRTDVDKNTEPRKDRESKDLDENENDNSTKKNQTDSDKKINKTNPHDEPVNRNLDVDKDVK
ncbi:MAG TPA: hypothetical protein VFF33_02065 [Ignavibacteriaceae bacterium]|nr:hypothetical protein [Ignavibacteriaceae bacterium]